VTYTTEPMPTAHLRRMVALSAAGQSAAQIAATLNAEGVSVPRGSGHPCTWPDRGVAGTDVAGLAVSDGAVTPVLTATEYPASRDGHVLPTAVGDPGRWNADAVTAVLAAPEADPSGNYAAARATLGSAATTTLTVA
jgi:hypothetical protein